MKSGRGIVADEVGPEEASSRRNQAARAETSGIGILPQDVRN